VLLPTPPFWFATAMIRAAREAAGAEPEVCGASRDAFEERCTAVGCVPEALLARLETDFGLEDERPAREEEGFVTDES
jgi:pyruvate/2-oxoglutarate dehydrogenase complex dihydrolipoamide dehydrogenase (E3) component